MFCWRIFSGGKWWYYHRHQNAFDLRIEQQA
jgi:hypothetical protein